MKAVPPNFILITTSIWTLNSGKAGHPSMSSTGVCKTGDDRCEKSGIVMAVLARPSDGWILMLRKDVALGRRKLDCREIVLSTSDKCDKLLSQRPVNKLHSIAHRKCGSWICLGV